MSSLRKPKIPSSSPPFCSMFEDKSWNPNIYSVLLSTWLSVSPFSTYMQLQLCTLFLPLLFIVNIHYTVKYSSQFNGMFDNFHLKLWSPNITIPVIQYTHHNPCRTCCKIIITQKMKTAKLKVVHSMSNDMLSVITTILWSYLLLKQVI
jgi:hypothetical protein